MVDSWDPATGKLVTIEGNVHEGIRPDAAGEAQRTAGGDLRSTTTNAPSSTAVHVRDMNDQQTTTPGARLAPASNVESPQAGPYHQRVGG